MTLTERIDDLIEARGMSRRQLAIAADIPPSSLQSAMARGRNMTAEMVVSIAQTLRVSSDWLLGLSKDSSLSPIAVDDLGLSPKNVEYIRLLNYALTVREVHFLDGNNSGFNFFDFVHIQSPCG